MLPGLDEAIRQASVRAQGVDVDFDMILKGMKDGHAGTPALNDQEMQEAMQSLTKEMQNKASELGVKSKKEGEDFLAANLEAEALTDCLQRLLTAGTPATEDLRELILLYGWKPVVGAIGHLVRDRDAAPDLLVDGVEQVAPLSAAAARIREARGPSVHAR